MRTVRRLYIYLVTLLSLELVVWGVINLLQNSLSAAPGSTANLFASGLSQVLVGLPFFLLHGWIAQREARQDPEEQASRLRALFHYAARLTLLSPVVLDLFNLLKEPLQFLLGVPVLHTILPGASPLERLIAIAINLAAWAVMERLLRADWRANPDAEARIEVRRLSRYLWMLYGLILATAGVFQTLQYLLDPGVVREVSDTSAVTRLVNGLALIAVGVPLWLYCWRIIQRTQALPAERPSYLRRVVLYGLALVSALVVLIAAQSALQITFQSILGQHWPLWDWFQRIFQQVNTIFTFGVLWAYFGHQVRQEWTAEADELQRAGLRRLYAYPLAAGGNIAVFAGAWQILGALVEMLVQPTAWNMTVQQELALGLALLLVGVLYWLTNWPQIQAEAARSDDSGDHARRSVIRKSYLYLVVFLTVVGLMSAIGLLLYRLINAALGNPGINLALEAWQQVSLIGLLAVWLGYHLSALRRDGRLALHALAERQSAFPVLVLQADDDLFYAALTEAIRRQAPGLPVRVHNLAGSLPSSENTGPVVVLPAALALNPSPELREWLAGLSGQRVLVPLPATGWVWAGQPARSARDLAHDTALLLRQLAEGQAVCPATPTNPWIIVGYILGGIFGLILTMVILSFFISGF